MPQAVAQADIERLIASRAEGSKRTHKRKVQRDILLLDLLLKTGLRRSEAANLRVRDINFAQGRLRVRGKGSKDRTVPLVASLAERLGAFCDGMAADQTVFGFADGRSLGESIRRWSKRAGVPDIHTHSFRHAFATALLDKGANIRAVQALLGHENLNTTAIYLAVTVRHLEQAVGLLESS